MTRRELEALDEALLYLNEGKILKKIRDAFRKKKEAKRNKSKDQEQLNSKGYTDFQYKWYYDMFKGVADAIKNDMFIAYLNYEANMYGEEFYYANLPQSKFESELAKFIKENPDSVTDDLSEYMEEHEDPQAAIDLFQNEDYICLGDNGGGDCLVYFIKKKFFMAWDHECGLKDGHVDMSDKMSYSDVLRMGKELLLENDKSDTKAAIAADANLGYYRLSTPPEGVKPIKF